MNFLETKIPPPLVGLSFIVLAGVLDSVLPSLRLDRQIPLAFTFILVALGLAFPIAGSIAFRRAKTTVNPLRPEQSSSLVTSGVFKYSRNPMYVGMALVVTAWASYLSSFAALFCVLGFIFYIDKFQIQPEERALIKNFGNDFAAYEKAVRRWL